MQDINNGEGVPYYYPADYSPTEWITHEEYEKWRMKMPTRGKCHSCGEIAFLTAMAFRNKETGSLLCAMVCEKCRKWYQSDEKEDEDGKNGTVNVTENDTDAPTTQGICDSEQG